MSVQCSSQKYRHQKYIYSRKPISSIPFVRYQLIRHNSPGKIVLHKFRRWLVVQCYRVILRIIQFAWSAREYGGTCARFTPRTMLPIENANIPSNTHGYITKRVNNTWSLYGQFFCVCMFIHRYGAHKCAVLACARNDLWDPFQPRPKPLGITHDCCNRNSFRTNTRAYSDILRNPIPFTALTQQPTCYVWILPGTSWRLLRTIRWHVYTSSHRTL